MNRPVRNKAFQNCRKGILLFISALCVLPQFILAQQTDARLRTGLSLEKKLTKQTDIGLVIEQRFDQDMSAFDRLLAEPVLSFKLDKKWDISISYRGWVSRNETGTHRYRQRGNLDLSYRYKINLLTLKLTGGLQYGIPDLNLAQSFSTGDLVSRNSLRASYQIFGTRFSPYARYELFTRFNPSGLMNYQYRATTGSGIYLTENAGLSIYYAFEHEFNIREKLDAHIWGIELKYEW
jgi:hypothetical protein